MSFKDFVNETIEKIKESQKPENVKARLLADIEMEKIKLEREKLRFETEDFRRERLEKKFGGWK